MRESGNLHPPRAQSSRFPRSRSRRCPRIWAERSVQVATRKALRPRSHGALEVRSVRVLLPVGIAPRDRGVGDAVRAGDLSVLKFVRHPNFPNPNPGKHVNSSTLEPNASTFSELLVHSGPFSTLLSME